eukprot:2446898-Amphidinium_carterae.1
MKASMTSQVESQHLVGLRVVHWFSLSSLMSTLPKLPHARSVSACTRDVSDVEDPVSSPDDLAESSGEHLVRTAAHNVNELCSKFCSRPCCQVVCNHHDVNEPLKRDDESDCCVCSGCCVIHHHDVYEKIACRRHPRQALERLDTVVAAVASSDADEIGDNLGLHDFEGEEEEHFGSVWDPKVVPDQVESLPDDANGIELDEALDVIQQDLQKEWDSSEHPRMGFFVMNNDVVLEVQAKTHPSLVVKLKETAGKKKWFCRCY